MLKQRKRHLQLDKSKHRLYIWLENKIKNKSNQIKFVNIHKIAVKENKNPCWFLLLCDIILSCSVAVSVKMCLCVWHVNLWSWKPPGQWHHPSSHTHPLLQSASDSCSLTGGVCVQVKEREREVCRQTVSGVKVWMLGMHLLSFDWEVNHECAQSLSLSHRRL